MARKSEDEERATHRLQVRLEPSIIDKMDELRRRAPDLPPRSEIIRRLVEKAWQELQAAPKRGRK